MEDPDNLSQLSCSRCKGRKVKCNRLLPKCGRCEARGVECIYPRRGTRRPVGKAGGNRSSRASIHGAEDDPLGVILERLQRVEDRCNSPVGRPGSAEPSGQANTTTSGDVVGSRSLETLDPCPPPGDFSAASTLNSAIREVETQVLRQVSSSVVSDAIDIPKQLAKTWVKAFFEYACTETFVNFIDRKLIELMPDLLEMDHVHLDGAITFVYYNVLYHGCGIAASTTNPADIKYCKATYICCLRALPGWQREATGSTTDLIAALSMVTICAESFDSSLGWQMYMLACKYAQSLNLQSLDADGPASLRRDGISDGHRKSFWEFIQVDLFIQLIFDKPPGMTATTWKVNMPWLDPDSRPKEKVESTLFLARSRITFILLRFFPLFEGDLSNGELAQKTEDLCRELQELYTQGRLGKWLLRSAESEADIWKIIDATLIGHTCIMFMLRKARFHHRTTSSSSLENEVLDSPLALAAARSIIDTSEWLLTRYPWPTSVAALFGAFKIHVAYGVLVDAVCRAADVVAYAADVRMLVAFGELVGVVSSDETEFEPLVRAVRGLSARVQERS